MALLKLLSNFLKKLEYKEAYWEETQQDRITYARSQVIIRWWQAIFSHNQNSIDNNIDGYHFHSQGPYDRQYGYLHFSQSRYQTKGETSAKRTSAIHEFIKFYRPIIQEHREFQEIASYLHDHFSPPNHPQLTPADNGIYHPSVNNITGSNNIPSSNPPVGFRSFACDGVWQD